MSNIKWELFTCKNTKADDKPNEDLAIYNQELHIGMLLDGVSRDNENGIYPAPSPSVIVTKIFADEVQSNGVRYSDINLNELQGIISLANQQIKKYNELLQHQFPAGTVGIVFSLNEGKFSYAYIGDCYGLVIRGNNHRAFTECQTTEVIKHKKEYTSNQIRFDICNHVSHPCGYGVWDGNPEAMDFVKYGTIKVEKGDVILLYSDGLAKEVSSKGNTELVNESVSVLFSDYPDKGNDDRTCIKININ